MPQRHRGKERVLTPISPPGVSHGLLPAMRRGATVVRPLGDEIRERVAEAMLNYFRAHPGTAFRGMADAAIAAYETARPVRQPMGTADYCAVCGGSPESATHEMLFSTSHRWVPRPTEPDPATLERMVAAMVDEDGKDDRAAVRFEDLALAAWRAEHGGS